ncbi:MAG: NAD(P)-dependent oxidoreductase [Bacteroidota bacterium]
MKVSFIGLGIMGSRMAANLLKGGIDLTVYNRSDAPIKLLQEQGAKVGNSYTHAVSNADVVFTMLSNPEVVQEIAAAILPAMKKGALWVDCSTVDPQSSLASAAKAKTLEIRFLDAPVTGTKPHAANAQLSFFVGGNVKDLTEVRPLLDLMGQKTLHLGDTGKGAAFKMLVNALLAQNMILFSETVLLGEKMGLSRDFLLDTLPNLVVSAPFTKFKASMIREGKYEVMFPLELMHKDLHLVNQMAYAFNQPMVMAAVAETLYGKAKQSGLGRQDFAAIHESLQGK